MGKVKDLIMDQEEDKKLIVPIKANDGYLECPKCRSLDILYGEIDSVCLECNLTDDSKLFITKKVISC